MTSTLRPLNIFEKAECLLDTAGKGNLNFTILSSHTGSLDGRTVKAGLKYLQQMHPLLRVGPNAVERITAFAETAAVVSFRELALHSNSQWRAEVKVELSQRFNKLDEPLWRVCLLKGESKGQLLVTFHHAIADGVCGMRIMNHLYEIFASLLNNEDPTIKEFNTPVPDIHSLYPLSSEEPTEDLPIKIEPEKTLAQDFQMDTLDEVTTQKVINWSKKNQVKVHAILFAALLMAVKKVLKPDFETLNAVTAVNYRSSFKPAVSNEVLALMRTLIQEEFSIEGPLNLADLAKAINTSVHSQLAAGKHVLNLKGLEKRLNRNLSPQELLQRCKFPPNTVTQTNIGALEFSGSYQNLALNELSFFADVTPFFPGRVNLVLGTLTFRNRVSLSLWFLEQIVSQEEAQAILTSMKEFLADMPV